MNSPYPRALHWLLVLITAFPAFSQTTTINLGTQGHNADFSTFPVTKPVSTGTVLPATCSVGQLFFNTSAAAGSNLYGCTAPNVWSMQGAPALAPAVTLSSNNLTYATTTDGITAAAQTVTVTNTGTAALTISSVALSGTNANDFAQTNNCASVAVEGTCTISVTFTPSTGGSETASLSIADNASGSPQTVALGGTGQLLNGGLVVTPSATTATINGTVTFTANRPVTFALAQGAIGTLQTIDSTHATYTAPSSIPVQTAVGGCPTAPNDSIFNTPITNAAVDSRSAGWLSQVGGYAISPEPAYPINVVTNPSQPMITRKFYYGGPGGQYPYYGGTFEREAGQMHNGSDNNDHHEISVLVNNGGVAGSCQWYEVYQDNVPMSGGITGTCQDGSSGCNATSGITHSATSYVPYAYGTNAPGTTINLMANLAEIKGNLIHHPMSFTMHAGFINSLFLWPTEYSNGVGGSNTIPYGARLRLRSSFNTSSYSQYAQNILNAWKNYGLVLLDIGDEAAPTFNTDVYEDLAVANAIAEASNSVTLSNFDVVNTDGLELSPSSLEVNPANTEGVTPVGFAYVTATDAAPVNGTQYSAGTGIALQGVAIGVPQPQLTVLAGPSSYTYQLPFWVTGTTNQNVTWSLTSGPGSVTSGGLYTVPAASSISGLTAVVLTGTAAADPNATITQYIQILPFSSDGNFRMVMDTSNQTDSSSPTPFTWWAEAGLETGFIVNSGHDYPSWPNVSGPEANIRQYSVRSASEADLHLRFVLPNGNYKTRLLYGKICQNYCGSSQTFQPSWNEPVFINVNGQTDAANYQWGEMVGYKWQTGWDYLAPAQVTNNVFEFWMGGIVPVGTSTDPGPELSAIEIVPDTSSAHIAIDTGVESWNYITDVNQTQPLSVAAGTTQQLNAVGWYMGNGVTWSVSGGGSITSSGLYTAPPVQLNAQTITVTATSTVNPNITATATLTIPGNGVAGVTVSPTTLTFPSTYQGAVSAAQTITLNSTGNIALTTSGLTFSGTNAGDFSQTNNCASVAVGSTCTINVKFTPSTVGAESATLSIADNVAGSPQTVALSGTGQAGVANGSLSPSTLTFPSTADGTATSALTLTLSDTGTGGIVSPVFSFTGTNAGDFSQTNNCGSSIAPSTSCTISVTFTPSQIGTEAATLSVADNASNTPQTVSLSGTGTASSAAVALSRSSVSFAQLSNGSTSNAQVLVNNTGSSNLIIYSVGITGAGASNFSQFNNCSSVAASSSCGIQVNFIPSNDTNSPAATLSIADNATGSPHTVALTGSDYWGTPGAFNPGVVVFPSTAIGTSSSSIAVTFSNTSSSAVTLSALTISGTNAADFSQTNTCGTSVAASGSCTITVTFKPSIAGVESAILNVPGSYGFGEPQTVSLGGIGH